MVKADEVAAAVLEAVRLPLHPRHPDGLRFQGVDLSPSPAEPKPNDQSDAQAPVHCTFLAILGLASGAGRIQFVLN